MAITCSWEYPLGTCYLQRDTECKHPIVIWGGGNSLAVFTYARNRVLQNFILDKQHFNDCNYSGNEYHHITIYTAKRPSEAKKLIECLLKAKFDFSVECKTIVPTIECDKNMRRINDNGK